MESTDSDQRLIAVGASVYAADGEPVGQVKALEGTYFEVDVEGAPDYWLSMTAVVTAEPNTVRLRYPSEVISRMAVPAPPEH